MEQEHTPTGEGDAILQNTIADPTPSDQNKNS